MKQRSLFNRLSKLFSTDVIVRNIGGNNLKVTDINSIQATGRFQTNALVDRFTRLHVRNDQNVFNPNVNYQTLRVQLYSDYEAMDTDPIIASTLDILADESTLKNEYGEVLTIKSSDENIVSVLTNLYYDILNIEFNLWSWIRDLVKYGDFFLKLEISEEFGIYNILPYTVYNISRQEGEDRDNPSKVGFTLSPDGLATMAGPSYAGGRSRTQGIPLENYEVAHFRLLSNSNYLPYGRSYIEPARKIFKQLTLMEDAMLLHRIMRAPEKRTFFINVGNIPPKDVDQFMQKTIDGIKKTPFTDPQTGDYNLKFNVQNMLEDFYIPVRGGDTSTRIETTKGLDYDGIQDVEYLRDKMFAALKVPKAYFGYEGDLQGKATLAAEDIRFARTVERIQRIVTSELTKIGLVHLYSQGFTGESLTNFEISLTTPSIIFEQEKIALLAEKVNLADNMINTGLFSSDYIYDHIFNMSENNYLEMRDLVREDAKRKFRLQQIENEGNDPVTSGISYGTPHDLATLYGRRSGSTPKVPAGFDDDVKEPGRPTVHHSHYGTQDDPLGGIDRIGNKVDLKGGYNYEADINEKKEGTTIDKTRMEYLKLKNNLPPKQLIFERESADNLGSLLDETKLKEL
jgi:hypothetical protein